VRIGYSGSGWAALQGAGKALRTPVILRLTPGLNSTLRTLPLRPVCVTLLAMGSKDKGRKEVKKAPKPKPKPEPGRKREVFAPAPPPK